eukprot:TRINITY_DN1636_c0_g1_i1.p1 TRINITY_DN1636_c0_g1~~TRINITY_DN1636_c0_g1_i1.p1  ORF type:complete len:338 (+),score=82.19 TRINITY_DN1636_c0_g1_i1:94-1014(+)
MSQMRAVLDAIASQDVARMRDQLLPLPVESRRALLTPQGDDNTPLHRAVTSGNLELCRFILCEAQGIPNIKGPTSITPLLIAAHHGHAAIVELLLTQGANVKARDKKFTTALHLVCRYGHYHTLCVLLHHAPRINLDQTDKEGLTAVMAAAGLADERVLATLAKHGARLDDPDPAQTTPLHVAVMWARYGSVRLLLDSGADVHFRGATGLQPIHLAVQIGNIRMLKLLVAYGADVTSKTGAGLTLMELADQAWHPKLKAWLLEAQSMQRLFLAVAILEMLEPASSNLSAQVLADLKLRFMTEEVNV